MVHRSRVQAIAVVAVVLAACMSVGAAAALAGSTHETAAKRAVGLGQARVVAREVRPCLVTAPRRKTRARSTMARKTCAGTQAKLKVDPQPLYWGATIGSQLTGAQAPWDTGALGAFEGIAGKSPSLIQFFQPFSECAGESCTFLGFPTTPMETIRSRGAIPVLSWSSQSIPSTLEEPNFQLSDVIAGTYDASIREFAEEAAAWGHPFFLRFNWEMNGNWFPWSEGVNGNQPGEFVTAWRHVHDIFAAVGASNVSWVWCPFVAPAGSEQELAAVYPGDAYVDWTGLDGYNWGTNPASPRGWRTFDQLFSKTYAQITSAIAPSKPLMIAELGSSEMGGSKSEWIAEALNEVPTEYPAVRALVWFDKYDDGMDWPVETSSSAATAFAQGIGQAAYRGAEFGALSGGPIAPPA
jgi:hypothetical protein